jgi:hypothetical protein
MKSVLLLLLSAWYAKQTTTQMVNDLEIQLRLNRDQYLGGPHTAARRQAALDAFDASWNWLHSDQACGSHMLGQAGLTCLSDRHRNGQWPWEQWYRDPIDSTPVH